MPPGGSLNSGYTVGQVRFRVAASDFRRDQELEVGVQ